MHDDTMLLALNATLCALLCVLLKEDGNDKEMRPPGRTAWWEQRQRCFRFAGVSGRGKMVEPVVGLFRFFRKISVSGSAPIDKTRAMDLLFGPRRGPDPAT
jgi:hypothetical protein